MAKKEDKKLGGLLIPAGLFIGMGVGFFIDELVAGMFIGLGAGFLAFFIAAIIEKKK